MLSHHLKEMELCFIVKTRNNRSFIRIIYKIFYSPDHRPNRWLIALPIFLSTHLPINIKAIVAFRRIFAHSLIYIFVNNIIIIIYFLNIVKIYVSPLWYCSVKCVKIGNIFGAMNIKLYNA